ncbi:hypothetical protein AND_002382 [Anopheles darlingi]|uniref:HTH OST-type domain-containing protein n=1 Tax=Anopheles darlingi TaxID=43151 RepID=W5JRA8_ANODA|nr:hypothetical protein AND_002382 [Anopheles darlingi]
MQEEIAFVKGALRALLISSGKSCMSLKELAEEFKETEGQPIPYAKFGFRTVLDFARSISDVLQLHGRPDDQDALVSVVSNATVSHIQHLVSQNKKNKKSKKSLVTAQKSRNIGYAVNAGQKVDNQKLSRQNEKLPNQSGKTYQQPAPPTANEYQYTKASPAQQGSTKKPRYITVPTPVPSVYLPKSQSSYIGGNQRSPKQIVYPIPMTMDWINCINVPPEVMGLGSCIKQPQIERFFKPNTKQPVTVLSIVNPNRMWITTSSLLSVHERMTDDLRKCYSDPATANRWNLQPTHVCYGLYCAAYWREKWHRAQIVGPLQIGSHLVKLRFIDFGRTELVHLSGIKYLVNSFQSFPACAVRASLSYLIPREHYWNRNHVHCLVSLLHHVTHTAYIVDANPSTQVVDIILFDHKGTTSINHLFAKSVCCKWKNKNPEMIDIVQYRNRVKQFSECHPSFPDIEEGRYPSVGELEDAFLRGFDFDQHYAHCIHNEVAQKQIFEDHKLTLERLMLRVLSATNPFLMMNIM